MKNPITLIIVDDNDFYRRRLIDVLNSFDNFKVINQASSGREFLALKNIYKADIIIMDVKMPDISGIEIIRQKIKEDQNLKFIANTMYEDENYVMELILAGAKGILFKNSGINELKLSISEVMSGKIFYSKKVHKII